MPVKTYTDHGPRVALGGPDATIRAVGVSGVRWLRAGGS